MNIIQKAPYDGVAETDSDRTEGCWTGSFPLRLFVNSETILLLTHLRIGRQI